MPKIFSLASIPSSQGNLRASNRACLRRCRGGPSARCHRGVQCAGLKSGGLSWLCSRGGLCRGELGAIGVEDLRREEYGVVVPMDRGCRLTVEGRVFEIWSLWPNLVRTSTLPAEGVRAPMIYGGYGDWFEFNGQQVEGRIALLEFNSEDRWLQAAALGARAVIFIEPERSTWRQANDKFVEAPLDIPRFWIGRNAGMSLLRRLGRARLKGCCREGWTGRRGLPGISSAGLRGAPGAASRNYRGGGLLRRHFGGGRRWPPAPRPPAA